MRGQVSLPLPCPAARQPPSAGTMRRRPEPGEWCALEVAGHLVDKLEIWRARAQAIASQERPYLDLYDEDALVQARSYRTAQLDDLPEELARWLCRVRRHRPDAPRGYGRPDRHPSGVRPADASAVRPDPARLGWPPPHPARAALATR
jgi:hypothetical protein